MSALMIEAPPQETTQWTTWAQSELGGAGLGDARLDARLVQIVASCVEKPLASIPQSSGDWAAAKAAYRFFDNKKVDPQVIEKAHRRRVVERAANEELVLAIGDTTMLDYTRHPGTTGLGPLSDVDHQGFLLHPTLVSTPDRVPLGLIDCHSWVRDPECFADADAARERRKGPIIEKESAKWLVSMVAADRLQSDTVESGTTVLSVFDREGDIFDVLAYATSQEFSGELLVRASANRRVQHPQAYLWETMEAAPAAGEVLITLPRSKKREVQEAELAVRFKEIEILPPGGRPVADALEPVKVNVVYAREKGRSKKDSVVSWMLITTLPVETFEDACRMIRYYCCRWDIELFFRVLKSGCKAEERQLETAERLRRCLIVDLIVAWRILYLTTVGRKTPDLPCTVVFEDSEWRALYTFILKDEARVPDDPPALQEVVRRIGRLGGHLGRKSDKEPGMITMWRGLQRLTDISATWTIMTDQR